MVLKPQDVYVVLKIVAEGSRRAPYAHLALELVMSPSEVHASVRRAHASGLLHGPDFENRPNIGALEEFLTHGLKYVFPAERGELTRGVATSYGAAPLRALIAPTDNPVWSKNQAARE
jgi:DNA-binding Lrp family transcriptional regulator